MKLLLGRSTVCSSAKSEERGSVMKIKIKLHWLPRVVCGE